jgi:hypothetical protein
MAMAMIANTVQWRLARLPRARVDTADAASLTGRTLTRPTAAADDDAYNAAMKAYSATPYEYKHELGLCACVRRGEVERRRLNLLGSRDERTLWLASADERLTTHARTRDDIDTRRLSQDTSESHRRHTADDAGGY